MRTDRLKKLADFLRTVPPERFDIEDFTQGDWTTLATPGCGSVACALGYCPLVFPGEWEWNYCGLPLLRGHNGCFGSATEFFEIHDRSADYLFDDSMYEEHENVTPSDVADRIEELIASADGRSS